MKRSFLVLCLALPCTLFVAHGAAAAEAVAVVQADAFPAIDQLFKDKKFDEALAAAAKASVDNPRSARAFFLLGKAHFYREQDAPAQAALGKAIELSPGLAEAYFFRGLTFNYGPTPAKSGPDFEKATQLDAAKATYWFELGKQRERAGETESAALALEKAAGIDPTMASAWFALGTIASGKGEHARAAALWEKTLAIDPKLAMAHYNLGIHHQLRGDAQASLKHFLAAAAQSPGDIEAVKKVVQAYHRLGDLEKAGVYRVKLLDLIAKSNDPKIRGMKEVCIDQFDAPGGRFFVYEMIAKDAPFFYWYTFKLMNAKGEVTKTINLENNKSAEEFGAAFMLGQTEGGLHTNFGVAFAKLPAYPLLKDWVLKANSGHLKKAATTRSTPSVGTRVVLSPDSFPVSFVQYQGRQVQLKRTYRDFDEYKDDPENLRHGEAEKVGALMRAAAFGPVFANTAALHKALSYLTFPGYGTFYANQLGAGPDPDLELAYVEIPMLEMNRYFVVEKDKSGSLRVVADFTALAAPEITRVYRGKTGALEYKNAKGMAIRPKIQ